MAAPKRGGHFVFGTMFPGRDHCLMAASPCPKRRFHRFQFGCISLKSAIDFMRFVEP